jgi:hypothetical protein
MNGIDNKHTNAHTHAPRRRLRSFIFKFWVCDCPTLSPLCPRRRSGLILRPALVSLSLSPSLFSARSRTSFLSSPPHIDRQGSPNPHLLTPPPRQGIPQFQASFSSARRRGAEKRSAREPKPLWRSIRAYTYYDSPLKSNSSQNDEKGAENGDNMLWR